MVANLVNRVKQAIHLGVQMLRNQIAASTEPRNTSHVRGSLRDLVRTKPQLIAENALLRQQLIVLNRSVKRPHLTKTDRSRLILLASCVRAWKDALLIIQPDTLLRWHRQGFHLFWRRKSRAPSRAPRIPATTITLIQEMALTNRVWGVKRIQGEAGAPWAKLGINVSKRTIQRYIRQVRPLRPHGQTWATFLQNHAREMWACDFLQLHDALFRPLFAFFITELGSRRIVHVGVTRSPTDAWVAQQLREATPFGTGPTYLIRDNDSKYGRHFEAMAVGSRIEVLKTPIRAPRANAFAARWIRSVRDECLDHVLIVNERHLLSVLTEYIAYYNHARPHQGIGQKCPVAAEHRRADGPVRYRDVLGGIIHDYYRAAA